MLSLPVLEGLGALVVSIHTLLAWGPLAGADFAVLLDMLEALDKSEDFVNVTTNGEVIELHVAEGTLTINDECSTEVKSIISGEAAIVAAELLGQVSEHGYLHATEATLLTGLVGELHMCEVGVD
jgi:hypothetical protein